MGINIHCQVPVGITEIRNRGCFWCMFMRALTDFFFFLSLHLLDLLPLTDKEFLLSSLLLTQGVQ